MRLLQSLFWSLIAYLSRGSLARSGSNGTLITFSYIVFYRMLAFLLCKILFLSFSAVLTSSVLFAPENGRRTNGRLMIGARLGILCRYRYVSVLAIQLGCYCMTMSSVHVHAVSIGRFESIALVGYRILTRGGICR